MRALNVKSESMNFRVLPEKTLRTSDSVLRSTRLVWQFNSEDVGRAEKILFIVFKPIDIHNTLYNQFKLNRIITIVFIAMSESHHYIRRKGSGIKYIAFQVPL